MGGGLGKLKVTLSDGHEYDAEIWAVDQGTDLALVKIELAKDTTITPAVIGQSIHMRAGEWVVALGSPLNLQNSVTVGVVSSIARQATELGMPNRPFDFIQTDAAINSGNSGGPLVNLDGEVIGINTMKAAGPDGISFSIPIDVAWPVLEQLKQFRKVRRPYIGLRMVTVDGHVARAERDHGFPQDQVSGVLVIQTAPGSPSERGGLLPGDIIVKINGKLIKDTSDVVKALGFDVGRKLEIEIRRGATKETKAIHVVTESVPVATF